MRCQLAKSLRSQEERVDAEEAGRGKPQQTEGSLSELEQGERIEKSRGNQVKGWDCWRVQPGWKSEQRLDTSWSSCKQFAAEWCFWCRNRKQAPTQFSSRPQIHEHAATADNATACAKSAAAKIGLISTKLWRSWRRKAQGLQIALIVGNHALSWEHGEKLASRARSGGWGCPQTGSCWRWSNWGAARSPITGILAESANPQI